MSKITNVRPVLLSAPYADADTNAEVQLHLRSGYRTCGLVEITLEDGTVGLGEGYLAVFAPRVFEQLIHLLRPYLIGRSVMDLQQVYQDLLLVVGYWSMQGAAMHAVSAVEIALQDCRAQQLGLPVYQLLGGTRAPLALYGSGGDSTTLAAMTDELDYLEARGIAYWKIRARNHEINKAVWCVQHAGKRGIGVAIDMTQNLQLPGQSASEVVRFAQQVEAQTDTPLYFLEEVLGPANTHAYVSLRQQLTTPVAGGEIVTTAAELSQRIEQGCYDIAQPDATVIGGITAVLEVFQTARRYAVQVVVHCWGGPVGMMANYHAALAAGGKLAEWPMPAYPLREAMVAHPWQLADGKLLVSDEPGLGVRLTPEVEQQYPFREEAIYACLADGSGLPSDNQWAVRR